MPSRSSPLLVLSLAAGLGSAVVAQSGDHVLDHQKISNLTEEFGEHLHDGDLFGSSAAGLGDLDGDGVEDLAVGADADGDGGSYRGAVWILFLNVDGTVKSEQKISDTAGGFGGALDDSDWFGVSLAAPGDLDGDGAEDLAVGACYDDDGGAARGAVWILFLNVDGTVKAEQKISDTAGGFGGGLDNSDSLGSSLAALGDLDDDGIEDLAVGAPRDDDGGQNRGAVWILFLHVDGTVKAERKISDTAGGFLGVLHEYDGFGDSVTGLADLDGDGVEDMAVGASGHDGLGYSRGAVWILFLNTYGTVKDVQKISDVAGGFGGGLDDGDRFGSSLTALGDLDADGLEELVVGARGDDDGGDDRGAAWIVYPNASGWVEAEQKISETAGGFSHWLEDGSSFGASIVSPGDLDGNGVPDAFVGIPGRDTGGSNRGAAAILPLEAEGTLRGLRFLEDGSEGILGPLDDGDGFGASVASPGDLDADGLPELVAGAPGDDDAGSNRGAVWILFLRPGLGLRDVQKISATTGGFAGSLDDDDLFGFAATALGDLDGDGLDELVVGAPGDDDGGSDRGAVWILFLDTNGTVRNEVKISDTAGGFGGGLADQDLFGSAVASVGDLDGDGIADLAVGSPGDDGAGDDHGAFWILLLDSGGDVRTKTRVAEGAGIGMGVLDTGDRFGTSLASGSDLDGDGVLDLAVGTALDDDGGEDHGALWILLLHPTSTIHGYGKVSDTVGGFEGELDDGDRFGGAVTMPGDVDGDGHDDLLVGASLDDDGESDSGAVWVLFCDEIVTTNASATWRNGSGVNPDVFVSTSLPILGTSWTSTVDGTSVGASGLVLVVGYAGMHPGVMTPFGELLIDIASSWSFTSWAGLGGTGVSQHAVFIPADPILIGIPASTQALFNNVGGSILLANAWDLVIGY